MAPQAAQTEGRPSLRLTRTFPVAAEKVWQAWTDPQALSEWFGPADRNAMLLADMDVREGGRYHLRFRTADGEVHDVSGEYTEVVPQRRLVFTWAWKSTPERVSRVSVTLEEVEGGTQLDLLHDSFFDDAARTNHERGWTAAIRHLGEFLSA